MILTVCTEGAIVLTLREGSKSKPTSARRDDQHVTLRIDLGHESQVSIMAKQKESRVCTPFRLHFIMTISASSDGE